MNQPYQKILQNVVPGAVLRDVAGLTGGVSAQVQLVRYFDDAGQPGAFVVRAHGGGDCNAAAAQETTLQYDLQDALWKRGWCVPQPLLLDVGGDVLPVPFAVMSFVDGSIDVPEAQLDDALLTMARTLRDLHAMTPPEIDGMPLRVNPFPEVFEFFDDAPPWLGMRELLTNQSSRIEDSPLRCLLHGDFWPGNLLWRHGALVAVLDWEDTALGDSLSDVAVTRQELRWKYGEAAMDRFTNAYFAGSAAPDSSPSDAIPMDAHRLNAWQVYVGLAADRYMGEWGLEEDYVAKMRAATRDLVWRAARALDSAA